MACQASQRGRHCAGAEHESSWAAHKFLLLRKLASPQADVTWGWQLSKLWEKLLGYCAWNGVGGGTFLATGKSKFTSHMVGTT